MGSLIVRSVEDDLIVRLKARAKASGRSAEAEHRAILRDALGGSSLRVPYGDMRGQIWIADDFDDTPQDIIDAMENGPV